MRSSSTQPPETEPTTRPSSRIARRAPGGRGADPHVSMTVTSQTAWPCSRQSRAWTRTWRSRLSMAIDGTAAGALLHEPAVTHHQRLAGQRVGREGGEEEGGRGDVGRRCELAIDGLLQHHLLDDVVLADAECLRLLGDLLVDQRRSNEAGADDVGTDAVLGA